MALTGKSRREWFQRPTPGRYYQELSTVDQRKNHTRHHTIDHSSNFPLLPEEIEFKKFGYHFKIINQISLQYCFQLQYPTIHRM